jgi:hypothetical protein
MIGPHNFALSVVHCSLKLLFLSATSLPFLRINWFFSCETLPIGSGPKALRQIFERRFEIRQRQVHKTRVKRQLSDQLRSIFHGGVQFRIQMLDFRLDLGDRFICTHP